MLDYPFTLYISEHRAFPQSVYDESGRAFNINADFRTVLKILDLYDDNDVIDALKNERLLEWFYKDDRPDEIDAFLLMFDFIKGHEPYTAVKTTRKAEYDYNFDADVIYSSFIKEYGIDLFDTPFLHWYKFRLLLSGLSDKSPFKQRIHIRGMSLSGLKGKALTEAREAKEAVRIPEKVYAVNEDEKKKVIAVWG